MEKEIQNKQQQLDAALIKAFELLGDLCRMRPDDEGDLIIPVYKPQGEEYRFDELSFMDEVKAWVKSSEKLLNSESYEPANVMPQAVLHEAYPPHDPSRWQSTDGFGDSRVTNEDRVTDAQRYVAEGPPLNEGYEFSDLISNLLHMAHELNLDPGEIFRSAISNFDAEAGALPRSAEVRCREVGWVRTSELTDGACELAVVQAFMEYNKSAWSDFEKDMESDDVLQFYDTLKSEFFSAESWEALSAILEI